MTAHITTTARVALLYLFTNLVVAQTTGLVGPAATGLTSSTAKVCNVLSYNYNVSVSGGDLAPALSQAWNDCKNGGTGICTCLFIKYWPEKLTKT